MSHPNQELFREFWSLSREKTIQLAARIGAGFPHAAHGGVYRLEEPRWWTAGFWPGLLWLFHRDEPLALLADTARACEERLDFPLQQIEQLDHDLGFMWTLSAIAQHHLTGNGPSRQRALTAASHLMGRFNLRGSYIRAWNPWNEAADNAGLAIIDCMMNLPLLYWASAVTGDPRFSHVAQAHADMALQYFIRADGSVYHILRFDPVSGEFLEALGGQGYAPESAWARGTSWALHGFALSYRYTREERYLHAAKKVAHFFLSALGPDGIPDWDFRLPEGAPQGKDTSAGACAASGLLELAALVPKAEAAMYRGQAERLVARLIEQCGNRDSASDGLLLHGAGHVPMGGNTDNPLIYGDYYLIEALAKLRGFDGLFSVMA